MRYPTVKQVEEADRLQLARWYRYLKSPGTCAIGQDRELFERTMRSQKEVLDRITVRFAEMGGMNSEISKCIGWG